MAKKETTPSLPAGYSKLIEMFNLKTIDHYRYSFVGSRHELSNTHLAETHTYPKRYLPKDPENFLSQLEFAFKYDGINLEIIKALFSKISKSEVFEFIKSQPTGKFSRKLWYLFENLTNETLDIPDANRGSYVLLLDEDQYYTTIPIRSKRHYVDDNLLGNFSFCPVVRKTDKLLNFENKHLDQRADEIIHQFNPETILRAMRFLYMKETMSSFEIERERPQKRRMTRFIEMLQTTEKLDQLNKKTLIEVQNRIVDPRFIENDYRNFQNYIGEEPAFGQIIVHFIPPRPGDLPDLMEGWFASLKRQIESKIHPVVIAATISFGFVFIHPFGDGNGRLHRFLIHYILSRTGFVQSGSIFPVSSTMLRDIKYYDQTLELFSKPLMKQIEEYELDARGELSLKQETESLYQYTDYTCMTEYLFGCIEKTIEDDFKKELEYLVHYDRAKIEIQDIVDMPDRQIDNIIRFIYQNNGKLSKNKRESHFSMLTESEIFEIEKIIQSMIA